MENWRRMPVQPVSAIRGGEGDVEVDKLGRLRQKGMMRRGDLANQSSGGKRSKDRGWKGLMWANREEGAGVVGRTVEGLVLRCVGLVLSCLVMFCLILSCWAGKRDGVDARILTSTCALAAEQVSSTLATMTRLDRLLSFVSAHPNRRKI